MTTGSSFEQPLVFAIKHLDDSERLASQSGGAFAVISDYILNQGGVVYGCAFDHDFRAVHIRAVNNIERNRMRYSKYVQSDMGEIHKKVLQDLIDGRTVLFSGTSCQIASVLSYVAISTTHINGKLYTVDIVCHGVPSPLIWRDYLSWESEKKKSKIKNVICRNKRKFGWKSHVTTIDFINGRRTESRVFPKLFYGHMALRPSCYKCPYKDTTHPSDITIADYWGIEKSHPEFRDEKGVSLILINSDAGNALFEGCMDHIHVIQTSIEDCMQKPLIEPYDRPIGREQFWEDYKTKSFSEIARKYGNDTFVWNVKWKLKYFLKQKGILKK